MAEFENFIENGEFFVEYSGLYLGSGSAVWNLHPQALESRRDRRTVLQHRAVSNIKWQITVKLSGGEQFWELFDNKEAVMHSDFFRNIFTGGGELKLFPVDPLLKGFCFCRCYPEKITRSSGSAQKSGVLELEFTSEAENSHGRFFQRIAAGTVPENAVVRKQPDAAVISRKLLEFLGNALKLTPGKELNLNYFAPVGSVSAMLELNCCREWRFNAPHIFDYTLRCRYLPAGKDDCERKLYAALVNMNDCRIALDDNVTVWSEVKTLELDGMKVVNGTTFFESTCKFSLMPR